MKKTNLFRRFVMAMGFVATVSISFHCCSQNDELYFNGQENEIYSDSYYESLLRRTVEGYSNVSGRFNSHFINQSGIPVWENLQWYETENSRMITVPLVSAGSDRKVLVASIEGGDVIPYIVELGNITKSIDASDKIYSLNHVLLYDTGRGGVVTRSIGSDLESVVNDVFTNNSSAREIFEAANYGQTYNGNANFGTLKIRTTDDAKAGLPISDYNGHTWIELDYPGGRTTFSLFLNLGSNNDYSVNEDLDRESIWAEMEMQVTYDQLQQILDYNRDAANLDWGVYNNCTDYSISVWNLISDEKIPIDEFGSIVTPKALSDYINNKK